MSDVDYSLDGLHVNHTGRFQYDIERNLEIAYVVVEQ
jgi:hypothetical protein